MHRLRSLILLLLLITEGYSVYGPIESENAEEDVNDIDDSEENIKTVLSSFRLPNTSIPINYKIKIIPHVASGNFSFDGESDIRIEVLKPTKSIILHAYDIIFHDKTQLKSIDSKAVFKPIEQLVQNDTQSLSLNFESEITPGKYILHMEYIGWMRDDDKGFYRAFYKDNDDNKIWLASTFFEAHNARRAFPCWDEPAIKATFDISIKHFPNYTAVSNMPVLKEESVPSEGKKWTIFETSPIMSSYLVAYVVSDYGNLTAKVSNVSIGFYVRKNAIHNIEYPFQVGQKALSLLEEYTNIAYPLPKLDSLSIPQFASGAVENWGAITYLESSLLVSDENLPTEKEVSARMVIHEYAHQWFGNLVSPCWWKYFWLSEGFATYLENVLIEKFDNYRGLFNLFIVGVQAFTQPTDTHMRTMPLNADINNFEEISDLGVFFTMSYKKGGAILNMLAHAITENIFRNGVQKYLQKNQYRSVTTDDLWEAMQEAVDEANEPSVKVNIKEVMDPWVNLAGHPLISVTRNYTNGSMSIQQEQYIDRSERDKMKGSGNMWWIPITFTSESSPNFSLTTASNWLSPSDITLVINGISNDGWLIFNKQSAGFYHVNYDIENWQRIAKSLASPNRTQIHPLNRAQLLNDARLFAKNFDLDVDIFMSIFEGLEGETDVAVWFAGLESIDFIFDRIGYFKSNQPAVQKYMSQIMNKIVEDLGFEDEENEDQIRKSLRIYLSRHFCKSIKLPVCEEAGGINVKLRKGFIKQLLGQKKFGPPKYLMGLLRADEDNWNTKFDNFKKNSSNIDMLNSLATTENSKLALKLLKFIIEDTTEWNDNVLNVISTILEKHHTTDFLLTVLEENKDKIFQRLGNNPTAMRELLRKVMDSIKTTQDLTMFQRAIEQYRDQIGDKFDTYMDAKLDQLESVKAREQGEKIYARILRKVEKSPTSDQPNMINDVKT